MKDWHLFLFSFNRGEFLKNCLDSIKYCVKDIDVTVIDDNSHDYSTKKILEKIEKEYNFELLIPKEIGDTKQRLGGLYRNMNFAVEIAKERKKKFFLFIQDDMQFVRSVSNADFNDIEKIFEKHNNIQQIKACFLKKLDADDYYKRYKWDNDNKYLMEDNKFNEISAFSDVGVFHLDRFTEKHVFFRNGERENNKVAKDNGLTVAQLRAPFMMWLPYSTSYKSKNIKIKNRIIEFISGCGFYPFDYLPDEFKKNVYSSMDVIPFAEDFLPIEKLGETQVWSFSQGVINLYARGGWRRRVALALWKIKNNKYE